MFTKSKFFAIIAIATGVLLLSSCSKDDVVSNPEQVLSGTDLAISDPQIKKEIEFMRSEQMIDQATYEKWQTLSKEELIFTGGLPKLVSTGVLEKSEEYLFSDPGAMDGTSIQRRDIQEMMKKKNSNVSARMKRATNMFASVGGTITIRVVESGTNAVSLAWRQALSEAILVWNNQRLKVKFAKVTASNSSIVGGYLTLYATSNTAYPGMFAYTQPVSSPGYFSEYIYINTASTNTPDINGKKYTMIHELGHAIGFMHTDSATNGTSIFNTVPTCNESNNANSFMFSGGSYNKLFSDFSTCDKTNLKYYWGY